MIAPQRTASTARPSWWRRLPVTELIAGAAVLALVAWALIQWSGAGARPVSLGPLDPGRWFPGRGLVLAKRVPPPGDTTDLERLAAAGWVDPCFPGAAAGVTAITWAAPA